ncbi:MAG: hypothetical protein Q9162_004832 [Coniocarpon cinnabarinum]
MSSAPAQSKYDIITGISTNGADHAPQRPPSRSTFRTSTLPVRADESNETIRKQLHKLEYELNNLRAEKDLTKLRHDEELRAAERKSQSDYERAQAAESAGNIATSRYDSLARELQEAKDLAAESRLELERQLRESQDAAAELREQIDEKDAQAQDREREVQRDINEIRSQAQPLQKEVDELKAQNEEKEKIIATAQQRVKESEDDMSTLQAEIVRLKAQTGDSDTLNVIKRELTEQVEHIQKLEAHNHRQHMELKKLREERKDVELVEEQKRSLEGKISRMGDLRKEFSEVQLQKQILEDERRAWTALLENESNAETDVTFQRPEDLARAYLSERLEKLSLIDQLGKATPELSAKDEQIQALETQVTSLQSELDRARSSVSSTTPLTAVAPDTKLKARLERQRTLAQKEVNYLRAQLRYFDDEQAEMTSETFDQAKSTRIKELENLLDEHRTELSTLSSALEKAEASSSLQPSTGSKRPRDSSDEVDASAERASSMARKARKLQDELNKTLTSKTLLEKELNATRTQLESFKASSQTRILEYRQNPTADAARIKQTTLDTLRAENESLLSQLENASRSDENAPPSTRHGFKAKAKTVPAASLERLKLELQEKERALLQMEKKEKRLKSTFTAQVRQFREACTSVLGWDLAILPNDRAKVTSVFDPTKSHRPSHGQKDASHDGDGSDDEEDEEEEERSIVFDAKQGTMKVSGGPWSRFADEIRGNIEYWVDGRKEVPCFLAACTLEFWERGPGAGTMRV